MPLPKVEDLVDTRLAQLVDSSTGKELPDVNTGIFTMPDGQAKQIDWSDEEALLNIDWSIYRDFCHPALKE